ncbi:hypothetical protein K3495_g9568 [Podosphaera aphanis]|nr:hypothetical protein K3495_g9568 [Podosphaera aphanis]
MSESQENIADILGGLAAITDPDQFLQGVQQNPGAVMGAIRVLAERNQELNATATQMHTVQQDLAQKDQVLLSTSHDLEAAQAKIKQLEKKVSTSSSTTNLQNQILNRLALALENFKLPNAVSTPVTRTTLVPESAVFRGDKSKFPSWKESVLLKLTANADHFPTD